MKKICIVLIGFVVATAVCVSEAQAFQIGAGLYSYCNWRNTPTTGWENVQTDPVLQVGPMLSLTVFRRFSVSASLITSDLIGVQSYGEAEYSNPITDAATGNPVNIRFEDLLVSKGDFDIALSYLVIPGLKLFLGFKRLEYQIQVEDSTCIVHDTVTGQTRSFTSNIGYIGRNEYDLYALGVSYSIPIVAGVYLMPNMSLLMGDGTKSHTDYGYNSSFTDFPLIDTDTEGKFKAYGTNLALSLTYYFDSINTTVALGGRYQAIFTTYSSGEYSGTDESWEHTWGITLSAMAAVSFFEE